MEMAERLREGVAAWRDPEAVLSAVTSWVRDSLADLANPDTAAFVAERDGEVVGFVCVSERSHFTGEVDAYIGELVVSRRAEGSGVGRALVGAAEDWGRAIAGDEWWWTPGQPTPLLAASMPRSGSRKKTSRSAERSSEAKAPLGRASGPCVDHRASSMTRLPSSLRCHRE
jgi:GNAT superfamily N-acetyltransferase